MISMPMEMASRSLTAARRDIPTVRKVFGAAARIREVLERDLVPLFYDVGDFRSWLNRNR